MSTQQIYGLIIIGGGPAGLAAAIYAGRYRLKTLVLAQILGGLILEGHKVCNYPGFEEISGVDLMAKFQTQAKDAGAELKQATVIKLQKEGQVFKVITQEKETFSTKSLLLALGTKHRRLNLPDEAKYLGKGLSYCYTCDGPLFKDKTVGVVGGANAAALAALYFAEICPQVYLIYRRDKLRAEPAMVANLTKKTNVKIIYNTNVIGLEGKEKLTAVILDKPYQPKDTSEVARPVRRSPSEGGRDSSDGGGNTKKPDRLALDGLFLEIGQIPNTTLTQPLGIKTSPEGYIITDNQGKTSVEGVWAAGDITNKPIDFRQVITAAAEGATCVRSIHQWLQKKIGKNQLNILLN